MLSSVSDLQVKLITFHPKSSSLFEEIFILIPVVTQRCLHSGLKEQTSLGNFSVNVLVTATTLHHHLWGLGKRTKKSLTKKKKKKRAWMEGFVFWPQTLLHEINDKSFNPQDD